MGKENSFSKLERVLELEYRRGCKNDAVIGGLERFLENWKRSIGAGEKEKADQVLSFLSDYSRLDGEQRVKHLAKALRLIKGYTGHKRVGTRKEAPREKPPAPTRRPPSPPPTRRYSSGLDAPIIKLPGIGDVRVRQMKRLGVETIKDLLFLYPRRYIDYSKITTISRLHPGDEVSVIGKIVSAASRKSRRGQDMYHVILSDGTGNIQATWFNQPFLARTLKVGSRIVLSGKVELYMGRLVMNSPEWEFMSEDLVHTGRLVPVYPLTAGLTARWMRQLQKHVVDAWAPKIQDYLPEDVRSRVGLYPLPEAIKEIHFPSSQASLEKARQRLAFDELFLIQLGMQQKRREWKRGKAVPIEPSEQVLDLFIGRLPFDLTGAQRRALSQILADMAKPVPMSRLLQGDVGSGKTVVAAAAMWATAASGLQSALMAPTEILAEQHFRSIGSMFGADVSASDDGKTPPIVEGAMELPDRSRNIRIARLTGSMTASEKRRVYKALSSGEVDIVIGTHALIQKDVDFARLGLVVVDEQHRFGVEQRAMLRGKGESPHMLVMSATPIPRTLALTLYGDLDLSVIDEMPPGRKPIRTKWLYPRERERAYSFLRKQVEQGHQAFIIYPLVEESKSLDLKAATTEYQRLQQEVFPDLKLGLVHGKMRGKDKDAVMRAFQAGEIDVLVATAVVEVGVDVPNATVMIIEGADRFGLAQLHQFRGRVGRGGDEAYCILISSSETDQGLKRLQIMEQTQNGFVLAEKDLEMRGPGEFFGTRQSGLPDLRMARLSDRRLLEVARQEAARLFAEDPDLTRPEHQLLALRLKEFWKPGSGDLS